MYVYITACCALHRHSGSGAAGGGLAVPAPAAAGSAPTARRARHKRRVRAPACLAAPDPACSLQYKGSAEVMVIWVCGAYCWVYY